VSDSDKRSLREFACNFLLEPDNRVSYQVSALIAKISRADWPHNWPELLPGLLSVIQPGGSWLGQRRGMFTLLEVLRELSQKTVTTGKVIMYT
jgi:hypothetical protein